jgi:hypothetical protein
VAKARRCRETAPLLFAERAVVSGSSAQVGRIVPEPDRLDVEYGFIGGRPPLSGGYDPLVAAKKSLSKPLGLDAAGTSLIKYLFCHRGVPLLQ